MSSEPVEWKKCEDGDRGTTPWLGGGAEGEAVTGLGATAAEVDGLKKLTEEEIGPDFTAALLLLLELPRGLHSQRRGDSRGDSRGDNLSRFFDRLVPRKPPGEKRRDRGDA